MATRDGMADILAELHDLIQDPITPRLIDDETIQGVLDRSASQFIIKNKLKLVGQNREGNYLYGVVNASPWEGETRAPVIKDADGETVAATADLLRGYWKFTTPRTDDVWLWEGYVYDLYLAAAEICNLIIARSTNLLDTSSLSELVDLYDISGEGGNYSRSQIVGHVGKKVEQIGNLRDTYQKQIRPFTLSVSEDR